MNLYIRGCIGASQFVPDVPTLALRILDPWKGAPNSNQRRLVDSLNYTVLTYTFGGSVQGGNVDENLILDGGTIPHFTEHLAKTILTDFEESWNGCEDLLIHCSAGTSRSPSVAIALNEIFDLGQNSNKLKRDYPNYSREIYWLLLSTHRRLNDPLGV